MAKIVAFSVPGITDGETALHVLDGVQGVADVVTSPLPAGYPTDEYGTWG